MYPETKQKIEESWRHIKPYMNGDSDAIKELKKMCSMCEKWYGKDHNYEECVNMPCFKFWLAYEYLEWDSSW